MRKRMVFGIYSSENLLDFSFTVYEIIEENMKNLIRDLLLAIEFFIHFCEVNSSPMHGEGSSGLNSQIKPYIENLWLDYNKRRYDVAVEISGNIHNPTRTPKSCTDSQYTMPNEVPTLETKGKRNFVTRAIFSTLDHHKYCLAFETENGIVFGVTIPPHPDFTIPRSSKGDPQYFNPDSNTYYITYDGVSYEVWNDAGHPLRVLRVQLYPQNKKFDANDKKTYDIRPHTITFAGVTFSVWQRNRIEGREGFIPDNTILAAQFPAISSPSDNHSG